MIVWYYVYPKGFETFITKSLDEALNICGALNKAGQPYIFRSLFTDRKGNPYYIRKTDYHVE